MATPQEIQANITALEEILTSGARAATIGGQSVTYNTTDSIKTAIAYWKGELVTANGGANRPRQFTAVYAGRGY